MDKGYDVGPIHDGCMDRGVCPAIRVLRPLDLRKRLGPNADREEGYAVVTSTMQRTLTTLGNDRRFPVIG